MIDIKNLKNMVSELSQKLTMVLYTRNLEFSVVRLIFLKYCVDNYIGASRIEDMQLCAKAQKMFAIKDIENGIHTIAAVLDYIDYSYGLNRILSGNANLDEYARELFGENSNRTRKNTDASNFKSVMDILSSMDLEEEKGSNEIGKELVDILVDNIVRGSYRNVYSGEITTRLSLCRLVERILDVKSDDVFCDFASGIGLSTLVITEQSSPEIINVDINNSTVAVAAMLYIMKGIRNFKIHCDDSLSSPIPDIRGDKIFVDAPFAMPLKKTDINEYTDSSSAVIGRVISNYLSNKKEALAVMTLPSSALFQSKKQFVELRRMLIERGFVKAVVALPPMKQGTSVGTNLLIISREHNDRIVFINAVDSSFSNKARTADISGETLLSDEKIDMIVDAINNERVIEGFSNVVTPFEIYDNELNMIPIRYVVPVEKEETITVAEIDTQLEKLYRQLMD